MIFDPNSAKLSASYSYEGILYGICQVPETGVCYAGGSDFAIYRLDPAAEKPSLEKIATPHESYVSCLVWRSPVIVSGGYDSRLVWADASNGEVIRSIEAHDGWVRDLAVFPDGNGLASVGDDMRAKIWDADEGTLLAEFAGHASQTPEGYTSALYAVALSPDGRHLASGDRRGEVRIWETESGKLAARLSAPEFYTYDPAKRARSIGGVRGLCFSPDGSRLALSGIGRVTNVDGFVGPCRVEVWDWAAEKRVFAGQDKHKAVLNHVAFHPQGLLVAAGGGDSGGAIAFWDQTSEKPAHLVKPKGHIQRFLLGGDGLRLAAAGYGGVELWDLAERPLEAPPEESAPPK